MLLDTAFKLFLLDRETYCTSKTLLYYRENVPKFINFAAGRLDVGADQLESEVITREIVLAYISSLRASGIKNTSANTYFRSVKAFLNYCIDEGYCDPDVLRKIRLLKSDKEPVIPLSGWEVDQIDGLFNVKTETGIRNLCIVHIMLDAGLRCSEVADLMRSNINFEQNYITVKGKGNKYRTVLLCPKLKRYLYHYLVKFRCCVPGEDYPVFVQIGTTEPINTNVIRQMFSRIKKKAEIDRVHPHLLRHTFATSYILGGGNMEFLRLMMGHSDYDTTKVYLHLAQQAKMLHQDIYRLDPMFFKAAY